MNSDVLNYLLPFVSDDEDRQPLMTPFWKGGYAYATDGRCAIRVACDENPWPDDILARPNVEALFVGFKASGEVFTPTECVSTEEDCEVCNGMGEVYCNMGHLHECDHCDDGVRHSWSSLHYGAKILNGKYVSRIAKLPGAKIWVEAGDSNPGKAVYITWDHGDGLLMPMKKGGAP